MRNSFLRAVVLSGTPFAISSLPKRESSKRLLRPLPICLDIYFIFNMSLCDCANRTVGMLIRSFPLRQTRTRSDGVPGRPTDRRNSRSDARTQKLRQKRISVNSAILSKKRVRPCKRRQAQKSVSQSPKYKTIKKEACYAHISTISNR